MCGIVGYVGPEEGVHRGALSDALATLAHRGPTSSGVVRSGGVSLGMARLAVIDPPGGQQPMTSPDGRLCVVFNGEIYNYRELRVELVRSGHTLRTESDTEVLLHLYEEHGSAMVDRLRGMFAFALHDQERDSVFLARDRFGKKPLYLRASGPSVWFGSELKAVLAASHGQRTPAIAAQSVYDFLSFGTVPQPATIYADVTTLPAGCWATVRPGHAPIVQRYWEPVIRPAYLSTETAVREVRRVLGEAVSLRLRSDVPLGVFLSGGIDSSIVAVEAARELGPSLRTFTVATGDPRLDESAIAARTAASLGAQHQVLTLDIDVESSVHRIVRHYDQPFADSSAIPSMAIAALAAERVTVVLNGDGGDELFGGYRRHVAARQLDLLGPVRSLAGPLARVVEGGGQARRRSRWGLVRRLARGLAVDPATRYLVYTHDLLREPDRADWWRGPGHVQPSERLLLNEGPSILASQMLNDVRLNLVSDLLVKIDMACMASSLEGRSPFLDAEVADLAFSLPDSLKVRRGRGKWLLRRAWADELSTEVLRAPKRGFEVPLARWMGTELRPLVNDTVLRPTAAISTYLDPARVRELFDGRALADRNVASVQYAVLMLELWLRSSGAA